MAKWHSHKIKIVLRADCSIRVFSDYSLKRLFYLGTLILPLGIVDIEAMQSKILHFIEIRIGIVFMCSFFLFYIQF